jgi:hypothetical protein
MNCPDDFRQCIAHRPKEISVGGEDFAGEIEFDHGLHAIEGRELGFELGTSAAWKHR